MYSQTCCLSARISSSWIINLFLSNQSRPFQQGAISTETSGAGQAAHGCGRNVRSPRHPPPADGQGVVWSGDRGDGCGAAAAWRIAVTAPGKLGQAVGQQRPRRRCSHPCGCAHVQQRECGWCGWWCRRCSAFEHASRGRRAVVDV